MSQPVSLHNCNAINFVRTAAAGEGLVRDKADIGRNLNLCHKHFQPAHVALCTAPHDFRTSAAGIQ